jgi:hypothetical protein
MQVVIGCAPAAHSGRRPGLSRYRNSLRKKRGGRLAGRSRSGTIAFMHGIPIVVGAVALVLITVVEVLVITKLPRSRRWQSSFLHFFVFSSIVAGLVVGFLTRGH